MTYDSRLDNTFRVWNDEKNDYRAFSKSKRGLYYTDMTNRGTVLTLETTKENESNYSDRDCNRDRATRKLQGTMGNISTKYPLYIIDIRLIPNFPITRDDLKAGNDILGTSIKALKGKTVCKS